MEDSGEPLIVPSRPIGSLVSRQMIDIAPGSTLRQVVAKLVDNDVGVIVVHDGTDAKGILSERDILDWVHDRVDLDTVSVDEVMQPDIISVDPEMSATDAGRVMIDRGVRHLMVNGPDGGVVSIRAILRSMLS